MFSGDYLVKSLTSYVCLQFELKEKRCVYAQILHKFNLI